MMLSPHAVEKPWGRSDLPTVFQSRRSQKIGEIWFEHPNTEPLPLLVKYIFTSEKLSVQVHPDDEDARKRGHARGKSESWYILDADETATLGLGLKAEVDANELRAASIDGTIEELLDWRPVSAGDFFYVPAGTIHAIGAGITLLEVQQNIDLTYRLYDYGRPRDLHLDDGVAVASAAPFDAMNVRLSSGPIDAVLLDGPIFSVIRASSIGNISPALSNRMRWVIPLQGQAADAERVATVGECLILPPHQALNISDDSIVLIAAEGSILD